MPASEPQLTYEDVFREFVRRSLEEEKKRCPVPRPEPVAAALPSGGDGADAAEQDSGGGGGADDRGPAVASVGRPRGRGRRSRGRQGLRGRGRGQVEAPPTGGGGGSSGSEWDDADRRPPPAKRARGSGRRVGRPPKAGRHASRRTTEPDRDRKLDQDSMAAAPEREKEEVTEEVGPSGRRRSSRRSSARSVDFKPLLDDEGEEDEDDSSDSDSDSSDGGGGGRRRSPAGDDWRPPAHGARSSADEAERGSGAPARPRRGRPPGSRGRGRGRGRAGHHAKGVRAPEEPANTASTPPPPSSCGGVDSVPAEGAALKTGDFLIKEADVDLERPPIWRIDGSSLIQQYEPIQSKGQRLYKNMATYMRWSANVDKFRPVSVRYHQTGHSEVIVELLDIPNSSSFNISKMLSIEATSKYLENFEIYMQTLISQALDANFLQEITQEGDEYFMKSVTIVQKTNLTRKNKILELKSWDMKTQTVLDTLPVLELLVLRNAQRSECSVCRQVATGRLVTVRGRPYDRTTLITLDTESASGDQRYNMCSFCAGLADLYNKVEHLTYHLYLRCCEKVAARRKESPEEDSTFILNDILADEPWLSKAFSDVQQVWGDVDQIYTTAKEDEEEGEGGAGRPEQALGTADAGST